MHVARHVFGVVHHAETNMRMSEIGDEAEHDNEHYVPLTILLCRVDWANGEVP